MGRTVAVEVWTEINKAGALVDKKLNGTDDKEDVQAVVVTGLTGVEVVVDCVVTMESVSVTGSVVTGAVVVTAAVVVSGVVGDTPIYASYGGERHQLGIHSLT